MDGAVWGKGCQGKVFSGDDLGVERDFFKGLGALDWVLCQFCGKNSYKPMWSCVLGRKWASGTTKGAKEMKGT